MAFFDLCAAGGVNFFSARLEELLAGKAKKDTIIDKLKQHLECSESSQVNLFLELYHKAIQHSELEFNYTTSLDELMQALESGGYLELLLEQAIFTRSDWSSCQNKIAKKVSAWCEGANFKIPAELGGESLEFVKQLHQFFTIYIELIEPNTVIKQQLMGMRAELQKAKFPVSALPVDHKQAKSFFHHYKYDRQFVEFQPNETLHRQLESFLRSEKPQRANGLDLKVIACFGRAGVGKSRTAFELCVSLNQRAAPWHAGFISTGVDIDTTQYAWYRPTLIVFDYAASREHQLDQLVESLKVAYQQGLVKVPVRIILLDRQCSPEFGWFKKLTKNELLSPYLDSSLNNGVACVEINNPTKQQSIAIAKSYAQAISIECNATMLSQIVETAQSIEKGAPRALIIQVVSELLLKNKKLKYQSVEKLLEHLFEIEEKRLTKNEQCLPLQLAQFWELVALATLSGGLDLAEQGNVIQQSHSFSDLYSKYNWKLAQRFFGNEADNYLLPNLEPDLLGEYAIVRTWRYWQSVNDDIFKSNIEPTNFNKLDDFLSLAFSINDTVCAESLSRVCLDFPEDNLLLSEKYFLTIQAQWHASKKESALAYCDYLSFYFEGLLTANYEAQEGEHYQSNLDMFTLARDTMSSPRMHFSYTIFAVGATSSTLNLPLKAQSRCIELLLDDPRIIEIPKLSRLLSQGLVNMIANSGEQDLAQAGVYLGQLQQVAQSHNIPEIQVMLAKGLVNAIGKAGEQDLAQAGVYLGQLQQVAQSHNIPEIQIEFAKGLFNIIVDSGEQDLAQAGVYLGQLQQVAQSHNIPEIQMMLAKGLVNAIGKAGEQDLAQAGVYLGQLQQVAQSHNIPEIQIEFAKGLVNIIVHSGEQDLAQAGVYLGQLQQVAQSHNIPEIQMMLAKGLVNAIGKAGEQDLAQAVVYLGQLQQVAQSHSIPEIQVMLAKGLVNIIVDSDEQDLAQAGVYLGQLQQVAQSHNIPEIQMMLAKGLVNTIAKAGEQDLAQAGVYLGQLQQVAQSHSIPVIQAMLAQGLAVMIVFFGKENIDNSHPWVLQLQELANKLDNEGVWQILEMVRTFLGDA